MKYLFIALLLLPFTGLCQVEKIYYHKDDFDKYTEVKAAEANCFRYYTLLDDGRYRMEEYALPKQVLLYKGYCTSAAEGSQNGHFIYYNATGSIICEGDYVKNIKEGDWNTYYPNSEQMHISEHYHNGANNGLQRSWYRNGQLKREEIDSNFKVVSGKCYNDEGGEISFTPMRSPANIMPDSSYIRTHIHVPAVVKEKNISGKVMVEFRIAASGKITDARVAHQLCVPCDAEALRLVNNIPGSRPTTLDGESISKSFYIIEVPFNMGGGRAVRVYYNDSGKRTDAEYARNYQAQEKLKDGTYKIESRSVIGDTLQYQGFATTLDSASWQGQFISYQGGIKSAEGLMKNNKKEGEWLNYREGTTRLWYKETYVHDKKEGVLTSYYPDGKLKRKETDHNDEAVSGKCFDKSGKEIIFTPFMTIPKPDYSINNYLTETLHYPDSSRNRGIEGRVIIVFVVSKDGSIGSVRVHKHLSEDIDKEAMRVIVQMPPWQPGRRDDVPVPFYFTQPISFKLD